MLPLTDDIKKVLSLTDLVLLDIKHIDSKKCKELVGFSNELELEFAKYLSDNNISMWIRQVIVPGVTDEEQDLIKLKFFLSTLKTVRKIELLPYHTLGKHKWKDLGLKYDLDGVRDATEEDIEKAKKLLEI
jgi:pyruvate formate lyase activating enzyme